MKLAFKFLMYYLAILPIAFAQSEAAEAVQNETVKLPECEKSPFEIKFLPDTKILYLRVTQECEGLIKELGSELRKPEYSSDEVVGYVFDLQGSKLSNQTPSIYGLTSIFVNLDSFLTEKVYGGKKNQSKGQIYSQEQDLPHSFKVKPLAILTGESTTEAADFIVLGSIGEARSIVLLGVDIKGGFWANDAGIDKTFINGVSNYFPVSNPVANYSNSPQKGYLQYLDNLGNCNGDQLRNWQLAIAREVKSHVVYPESARWGNIEGSGTVVFEALSTGKIANVKVSHSTGSEFLDRAMIGAANASKIQPLSCLKVGSSHPVVVPFSFKLQPQLNVQN